MLLNSSGLEGRRWSFFQNSRTHQAILPQTIFTGMSIFHCGEDHRNLSG